MTDQVLLRRFLATGLPTRAPSPWAPPDAVAAVGWLGAVQAQEFDMTLWSLGRRCAQPRDAVLAAYNEGRIVRAHAIRQTWHLLRAEDFAWIQAATAPRVRAVNAKLHAEVGLDSSMLARTDEIVATAVAERAMTRRELGERLTAHGIEASGLRLGFILMNAEMEGRVASGPMRGKQHTYAPAPAHAGPVGDAAMVTLARMFLRSHGPASLGDFARWATLSRTTAREALEGLGTELIRVPQESHELFALAGADVWLPDWDSPQIDLLNGYDEYLAGASETKPLIAPAWVFRQRPGAPIAVVTADGMLAGNWRRKLIGSHVEVEVEPLRPFSAEEEAAVRRQARDLGRFLERDWTVRMLPQRRA